MQIFFENHPVGSRFTDLLLCNCSHLCRPLGVFYDLHFLVSKKLVNQFLAGRNSGLRVRLGASGELYGVSVGGLWLLADLRLPSLD